VRGLLVGGRGGPLAGPLASSRGARNPRDRGVIWPVAPMTLLVPSFLSFFLSFASPSPWRLLPARCEADGGGGGS
jgi:hypothetical protein